MTQTDGMEKVECKIKTVLLFYYLYCIDVCKNRMRIYFTQKLKKMAGRPKELFYSDLTGYAASMAKQPFFGVREGDRGHAMDCIG